MDEKRLRIYIFLCNKKFVLRHQCKKRQLYILQVKDIIIEEKLDSVVREIIKEEEEGGQGG